MSEEVMKKHIDLYVNNYSIDLGSTGQAAVEKLLNIYQLLHKTELPPSNEIFLTPL